MHQCEECGANDSISWYRIHKKDAQTDISDDRIKYRCKTCYQRLLRQEKKDEIMQEGADKALIEEGAAALLFLKTVR